MVDQKITEMTELTTPDTQDFVVVSQTISPGVFSSRKVSLNNLFVSPGVIGGVTPNSGIFTTLSVAGFIINSVTEGIVANLNSSQGDTPLISGLNEISVVSFPGDAVTLPTAVPGLEIKVINNGVNSADVFPSSGDNINGAGVDIANALPSGSKRIYVARNDTDWEIF